MLTDWLDKVQDGENVDSTALTEQVTAALRQVYDPEIPVNIYDLGLIYRLDVDDLGVVEVDMTLTAPGCPVAQTFPGTVEGEIRKVPGVTAVHVELVWDPPWDPPWDQDRMSDEALTAPAHEAIPTFLVRAQDGTVQVRDDRWD